MLNIIFGFIFFYGCGVIIYHAKLKNFIQENNLVEDFWENENTHAEFNNELYHFRPLVENIGLFLAALKWPVFVYKDIITFVKLKYLKIKTKKSLKLMKTKMTPKDYKALKNLIDNLDEKEE